MMLALLGAMLLSAWLVGARGVGEPWSRRDEQLALETLVIL